MRDSLTHINVVCLRFFKYIRIAKFRKRVELSYANFIVIYIVDEECSNVESKMIASLVKFELTINYKTLKQD